MDLKLIHSDCQYIKRISPHDLTGRIFSPLALLSFVPLELGGHTACLMKTVCMSWKCKSCIFACTKLWRVWGSGSEWWASRSYRFIRGTQYSQ